MFDLRRPCVNCPFRKGQGQYFQLDQDFLRGLRNAPAFQCHKTVDYDADPDTRERQGEHPQQCAGLMSILHREGTPNTIMQVGQRLGHFDPDKLDHSDAYASMQDALAAHKGERN